MTNKAPRGQQYSVGFHNAHVRKSSRIADALVMTAHMPRLLHGQLEHGLWMFSRLMFTTLTLLAQLRSWHGGRPRCCR